MKPASPSLLAVALICGCGTPQLADAAVIAASGFTNSSLSLTSLTIGSTTYSDLSGATASIVGANIDYWVQGTLPALTAGSANIATSGLSYRDGVTNIDVGSVFQFGRVITASDYIFISDLGVGDPISFQLVNSSNAVLGTYTLSLTAANFGATDLIASTTYTGVENSTGGAQTVGTFGQRIVAFQLSDFTGTGDLSTATGIRLSTGDNIWDPSVVGLAAIPEPSSWTLTALGLAAAGWRTRRSRTRNSLSISH